MLPAALFAITQFVALGGTALYWTMLPVYIKEGREKIVIHDGPATRALREKATMTMARVQLLLSEQRLTAEEAQQIKDKLLEEYAQMEMDPSKLAKIELNGDVSKDCRC